MGMHGIQQTMMQWLPSHPMASGTCYHIVLAPKHHVSQIHPVVLRNQGVLLGQGGSWTGGGGGGGLVHCSSCMSLVRGNAHQTCFVAFLVSTKPIHSTARALCVSHS